MILLPCCPVFSGFPTGADSNKKSMDKNQGGNEQMETHRHTILGNNDLRIGIPFTTSHGSSVRVAGCGKEEPGPS